MQRDSIPRSLYYYELFAFTQGTDGLEKDKSSKVLIDFFHKLYEEQKVVEKYKDFAVHMQQGEEFIIVEGEAEDIIKLKIVLCRENALPFVENDGKLENLETYIDTDKNIAEVTHCIFFKKYGILGAEYNFNGARATSIPEYISKRTDGNTYTQCHPKINYDTYGKLIEGETFSLFDFAVKTDSEVYNRMLSKKSIFSALQTTVPESDTMEIVLRKRKTKKNKQRGFDIPFTFEELKEFIGIYREDIVKLNVSQGQMSDSIDLLADKFVGKVFIAKTKNRVIDSNEMYESIVSFFDAEVALYCPKWEE